MYFATRNGVLLYIQCDWLPSLLTAKPVAENVSPPLTQGQSER